VVREVCDEKGRGIAAERAVKCETRRHRQLL
jgi:hypothetical protein